MFHYYFQLFLPMVMLAVFFSFLTYHVLGWSTLGGYISVFTVAVFGAFLGGVLGMMLGPSEGDAHRWLALILPAGLVCFATLLLFHHACRLYEE